MTSLPSPPAIPRSGPDAGVPWIIGHRGAPCVAPENTLESLLLARSWGADGVEYDVQTTRDGHAVLLHDDDLFRTTGVEGRLSDFRLADLEAIPAGSFRGNPCRIPRLEAILERVSGIHDVEIKLPADCGDRYRASCVAAIAPVFESALRRGSISRASILTSFDQRAIEIAQNLAPTARTGWIVEDGSLLAQAGRWRPPRPVEAIAISWTLAEDLRKGTRPLPDRFRSCEIWVWGRMDAPPRPARGIRPTAWIVDSPVRPSGT